MGENYLVTDEQISLIRQYIMINNHVKLLELERTIRSQYLGETNNSIIEDIQRYNDNTS